MSEAAITHDIERWVAGPGWGLILTGGANWGAVQAGAAKALFERGFAPEVIVGVSVGAINGAYLAARPTLAGTDELIDLWERADAHSIFGGRLAHLRELAGVLFGDAAFSNRALGSFLEDSLPAHRFDETATPLAVVASELTTGTPRLLTSGDLIQAVLASGAIPGVFPPVDIDGERLFDGAITDPFPLHVLLEHGIHKVMVVEAGRPCGCDNDLGHTSNLIQRAITVVMQDRMDLLMQLAPPDVELVRLGRVCHTETPITDLSHAGLRVHVGYTEAVGILDA